MPSGRLHWPHADAAERLGDRESTRPASHQHRREQAKSAGSVPGFSRDQPSVAERKSASGVGKFVLDIAASQLDHGQTTSRLRKLLKPRARSVLRGMINHLLSIEVKVVL